MSDPFRSTYTTSYRPPSAWANGTVLPETQGTSNQPQTPTGTDRNFTKSATSPIQVTISPRTNKSNESHILGQKLSKDFKQPSSTYKTEYIRSYSPPREKLESTSPTKSRNQSTQEKSTSSYSSPASSAPDNNTLYDPANTGVGTPVGQDQGNFDYGAANTGTAEFGTKKPSPSYSTEYNRSYSPPRDKIHLLPDDSDGKFAETSYFPPAQYQGRHQQQLPGRTQALGDSLSGAQGSQDLNETQNVGLGGTQTQTQTAPLEDTQGTPQRQSTGANRSEGRGRGSNGSPKSPYYKTEYVRQYSPPRDKKVKADNL